MAIGDNGRPVAAITGASSGLGQCFARHLAAQGYDLLLIARRYNLLEGFAREIRDAHKVEVECLSADLSTMEGINKTEQRIQTISTLEYMINNAGFGGNKVFPNVNIDLESAMITVHCLALMRLCRAALIPMTAKKSGKIINLASVAGYLTGDGSADYSGTKAFVIKFSTSLQCDVLHQGIRVQALCPGFTRTGFHYTEVMKDSPILKTVPGWLWLGANRVVRCSLRAVNRRLFYRVICLPSVKYKIITYFGWIWWLAPIRILFSGGRVR